MSTEYTLSFDNCFIDAFDVPYRAHPIFSDLSAFVKTLPENLKGLVSFVDEYQLEGADLDVVLTPEAEQISVMWEAFQEGTIAKFKDNGYVASHYYKGYIVELDKAHGKVFILSKGKDVRVSTAATGELDSLEGAKQFIDWAVSFNS